MDTQELKHRGRDEPTTTPATDEKNVEDDKGKRNKRMAMAKRGLKSLIVAVAVPLSLTFFSVYFLGSDDGYGKPRTPVWFPPLWLLHVICMASTFLMGVSAWLVWAEGGFHKKPTALYLYLAQLGLALVWDPIVFKMGAGWIGWVVSLAMLGALVGYCRVVRELNPIASDLVKPCLAWSALLAIVNLKLVFL